MDNDKLILESLRQIMIHVMDEDIFDSKYMDIMNKLDSALVLEGETNE